MSLSKPLAFPVQWIGVPMLQPKNETYFSWIIFDKATQSSSFLQSRRKSIHWSDVTKADPYGAQVTQ